MRSEPVVFLPLSQGKVAVIDFADFELVRGFKYRTKQVRRNIYAIRSVKATANKSGKTSLGLHRDILGLKPGDGIHVDHIDSDGRNNTRLNLRLCSALDNTRHRRSVIGSTSKYLGVSWEKGVSRWRSQGKLANDAVPGRGYAKFLGNFDSEVDAARAYDVFAREHYGEFANCNFPAPALP